MKTRPFSISTIPLGSIRRDLQDCNMGRLSYQYALGGILRAATESFPLFDCATATKTTRIKSASISTLRTRNTISKRNPDTIGRPRVYEYFLRTRQGPQSSDGSTWLSAQNISKYTTSERLDDNLSLVILDAQYSVAGSCAHPIQPFSLVASQSLSLVASQSLSLVASAPCR